MKKIFSIFAIAALLATSCAMEDTKQVKTEDLQKVTLTLKTPQLVSRAFGDGQLADNLVYGVYDDASQYLGINGTATFDDNLTTTITLDLVVGKKYYVLCWAYADNSPYTIDLASKNVTANYAGRTANDDKLDAFYAWHEIDVYSNMASQVITLYRPFAQLNYGTTQDDLDKAKLAGVVPTHSSITVTAYTKFNLETGEVDTASKKEIVFEKEVIPNEPLVTLKNGNFVWMGTTYILWSAEKAVSAEACTLNMYETKNGVITLINNPITEYQVPFQRNWRTHIIGESLLTEEVSVNVIIEEEFYDQDEYIHPYDGI